MLEVIRTKTYLRHCSKFWSEEEILDFEEWIAVNYEAGKVVARTRGLRKVRAPIEGRGKSGGARVIYYLAREDGKILLLAAHTKSEAEKFSDAFMAELRKMVPYD